MLTTLSRLLVPAALGTSLVLAGCSDSRRLGQGSKLAGEATFDPAPADQTTLEAQLKRYKGQTQFLTPGYAAFGRGVDPVAARAESGVGGARAIQEADVFKIGKHGSSLLFLLNDYRGLQVVSFASPFNPQLLGRVEPTGNYANAMYYDEAHDRLVVLENNYQSADEDYYDYSDVQSRALVYDVKDPKAPKLAATIDLKGTLSESRMVGHVLYVATSVRPDWNDRQAGQNGKGFVYALGLAGDDLTVVDSAELAAPVSYAENMNVVEVKEGDALKYYLVAILSKDGWSWWDRQSLVQVVDISDENGKIKPVMVASAKGVVRERSQTTIKNGTLVVTSNYTTQDGQTARLAVETFLFPVAGGEVIDADEAEFRRLNVARELAKTEKKLKEQGVSGTALEDALDAARATLLADATLGLKGRFVEQKSDAGTTVLLKSLSDSVVTVGDSHGLSASLQDVRYQGDKLYAFWVPANNIDPLDVFDLSAPEKGVKHLAHLEFEGWVQRAIPVTYQGHDYVLGLGWIVPTVDSERNRRYPQATLFEIRTTASGTVKAQQLAQKTLTGANVWTSFNGQDKELTVSVDDNGTGTILYPFSSWDSATGYLEGGKLVGFDLNAQAVEDDKVFAEGGVLVAPDGWLKRLFENPETKLLNAFADKALATYPSLDTVGTSNADELIKAANILELARNVRAYETVERNEKVRGVQIVSDYSWFGDKEQTTELRLVAASRADSELKQSLSVLKVPGSYVSHVKLSDDTLLVLTQVYKREATADGFTYKTEYTLSQARFVGPEPKLILAGASTWTATWDARSPFGYQQKLVVLSAQRVLVATYGQVKDVALAGDVLTTKDFVLEGCALEGKTSLNVLQLSGKLYLASAEQVVDAAHGNQTYYRNFVAPLTVTDAGLACGAAVNVPGTPVAIVDGKHVVTDDRRLLELKKRGEGESVWFQQVTETDVASLALGEGQAKLVDLYDPKNVDAGSMKVVDGDTLVFVESSAKPGRVFFESSRIGWGFPRPAQSEQKLVVLGFDQDLDFTKTSYSLDLPLHSNASLQALIPSPKAGEGYLAVITQGRSLAVVTVNGGEAPVAKKLRKLDPLFAVGEAQDVVSLAGYRWWGEEGAVHFTPELRTLEVPEGLHGVTQIQIED